MKHESLKKSTIYRSMAFSLGVSISILAIFLPRTIAMGVITGIISELLSFFLYYTFEHYWRKLINRLNLKKGTYLFMYEDGHDKVKISYNVIEVLDDNKFIIEVV